MKVQIILASILSLISALPTSSPIDGTAGSISAPKARNPLAKRDLYCHSGYSAQVCEDDYGVYCDGSGELIGWSWPDDGRSCTSRQCWCN